jgi:hypothetical protein
MRAEILTRPREGTVIGTATTDARPGELVEVDIGDRNRDYAGWFCIATDPWECPNPACDFVANHCTAMHRVIVWPEKDDENILEVAAGAQKGGRNPRIVEYEVEFGPCVSYYALKTVRQDGWMPVHGLPE